MNFDFSESQKQIQESARKLLSEQCTPAVVRAVMESEQQSYDNSLWQKIRELGWLGAAIPEDCGGLGLGYLELCVLAQELGRAVAPVPFASTVYLFAEAIKLAGSAEQKKRVLEQVASGEIIGCLAVTEKYGQSATHTPDAKVSGGKLTGKKIAVLGGDVADKALVSACENGVSGLYLVDLTDSGVQRARVKSIDLAHSYAQIQFDAVDCEALESSAGSGSQIILSVYEIAAVLLAFEQVGGSEAALEMGCEYTRHRYAFGRPVASFQAIKHKFADMYVAKELALSNAYYAAWALSSGANELALASATARVSATSAYDLCSRENIQVHGGMGFTWEFDCHLHYRRSQALAVVVGSLSYWRQQLSRCLLQSEAS